MSITSFKLDTLKKQQINGTIFNDLDDEKLYTVIDFNEFENIFRLGTLVGGGDGSPKMLKKNKKPETILLLEANRSRNVAITRRKIELTNEDIVEAINCLDLKKLSVDDLGIMMTILPNENEINAFKNFEREKQSLNVLSDEDNFMFQMVKVERLTEKLQIMRFIGNYYDNINTLQPQVNSVIKASKALSKLTKISQNYGALGNYMNSKKMEAVCGFKLQSLDLLMDTKSGDEKTTLMHFLVMTVPDKTSALLNFDSELPLLDKAAGDIRDLERCMELTKRESALSNESREDQMNLKDFLSNTEEKFNNLLRDVKTAQDSYKKVVEFFGENPTSISSAQFFSQIVRFVANVKQALIDNERRKLGHGLLELEEQPVKKNLKSNQEAMVKEIKNRNLEIKEQKRLLNQDDTDNGKLETLLLDFKNEPYRRTDALQKTQRRRSKSSIAAHLFQDKSSPSPDVLVVFR